jgi:hypothetical protein
LPVLTTSMRDVTRAHVTDRPETGTAASSRMSIFVTRSHSGPRSQPPSYSFRLCSKLSMQREPGAEARRHDSHTGGTRLPTFTDGAHASSANGCSTHDEAWGGWARCGGRWARRGRRRGWWRRAEARPSCARSGSPAGGEGGSAAFRLGSGSCRRRMGASPCLLQPAAPRPGTKAAVLVR